MNTDQQLEAAMATAATCFEAWRQTTFADHAAVATKAAGIMRARVDAPLPRSSNRVEASVRN
jgi:succinate-semialdehyde dehydrogenase / glutarate-semialdehyde dehydrogenase